jgi:gamma-glutamylcyclotransferase
MEGLPIIYFAYGANMDASILARRLGRNDVRSLARRRGLLVDFAIGFGKISSSDPAVGYATVISCGGAHVEGVLNNLTDAEINRLDEIELVPEHYTRATLGVIDTGSSEIVEAAVYIANPAKLRTGLMPLASYIDMLLGGRDILSVPYVDHLAEIRRACHSRAEGTHLTSSP